MTQRRVSLQINFTGADLEALEAEKAATGASQSHLVRTYFLEHIRARAENARAINGDVSGTTVADMITGFEARLATSLANIDRTIGGLERSSNVTLAMLDTFVKLYLIHTPEIAQDAKNGAAALTNERYRKFMQSMQSGGFKRTRERLLQALEAAIQEVEAVEVVNE